MWKKIKAFLFEDKETIQLTTFNMTDEVHKAAEEINKERAIKFYCFICDRGFKTIGATNAHKRLKHGSKSIS